MKSSRVISSSALKLSTVHQNCFISFSSFHKVLVSHKVVGRRAPATAVALAGCVMQWSLLTETVPALKSFRNGFLDCGCVKLPSWLRFRCQASVAGGRQLLAKVPKFHESCRRPRLEDAGDNFQHFIFGLSGGTKSESLMLLEEIESGHQQAVS